MEYINIAVLNYSTCNVDIYYNVAVYGDAGEEAEAFLHDIYGRVSDLQWLISDSKLKINEFNKEQ